MPTTILLHLPTSIQLVSTPRSRPRPSCCCHPPLRHLHPADRRWSEFSPSLLRHLLLALKAPAEDQELARHNQISTNELVRRARAANTHRAERRREVVARERDKAGRKGADLICNWLVEEQISGPDGERSLKKCAAN